MTNIRHMSHELTSQSLKSLSEHLHEALRVSICQMWIYQALDSSLFCLLWKVKALTLLMRPILNSIVFLQIIIVWVWTVKNYGLYHISITWCCNIYQRSLRRQSFTTNWPS